MIQRPTEPLLRSLFNAAVAAADPAVRVPQYLPPPPKGRTIVVGAGKASAAMAAAVEAHWPQALEGLVVTRYGHGVPCERIEIVEAAHPVPDRAGNEAAARIARMVQGLSADDLVLCLISGGGSALLAAPADSLRLADKQDINRQLLASGAPISVMNCVRKHLSALKGGRLAAAAYPARVVSLIVSDIPGDDPSLVASGPTVADPSTSEDALAHMTRYGIRMPEAVAAWLADPASETPKPGDPRLARAETRIIAAPALSLEAAAMVARGAGYEVVDLGDRVEGESRVVAIGHAALARTVPPGTVILSGGETTVTIKGEGRGGRNCEYALALALALESQPAISAIAGDTDGIDGSEDNAGAMVFPDSLARAAAAGLDPPKLLHNNDSYRFFARLGDLVVTGPTLTNVNDFRAIVVEKRE
ncbi:MAG TPA: glycerate kinase [Aestuariivirgaceae bacterium]|nr:glycerate kinase [Aestuariivirgaceae bacterium]